MDAELATTPERKDAWERLAHTRIAVLVTLSEDHGLRGRPLTTQRIEPEARLWFFVAKDSDAAAEVAANPRVLVMYANEDEAFYASLTGIAKLVTDAELARAMWSTVDEAWFPGGPDDSNLAILRVDLDHGECWEPTTNRMMQFLSIAAAAVSHKPPRRAGVHRILQ
jgi:general stress protein 26